MVKFLYQLFCCYNICRLCINCMAVVTNPLLVTQPTDSLQVSFNNYRCGMHLEKSQITIMLARNEVFKHLANQSFSYSQGNIHDCYPSAGLLSSNPYEQCYFGANNPFLGKYQVQTSAAQGAPGCYDAYVESHRGFLQTSTL